MGLKQQQEGVKTQFDCLVVDFELALGIHVFPILVVALEGFDEYRQSGGNGLIDIDYDVWLSFDAHCQQANQYFGLPIKSTFADKSAAGEEKVYFVGLVLSFPVEIGEVDQKIIT